VGFIAQTKCLNQFAIDYDEQIARILFRIRSLVFPLFSIDMYDWSHPVRNESAIEQSISIMLPAALREIPHVSAKAKKSLL
jgi:hypothetical protein